MNPPFPLLLKLAAAATTGTAALLSFRRHHQIAGLHSLRRNIHDALLHLYCCSSGDVGASAPAPAPPVIIVTGFCGHGKSAFINTACRVLAGESGPLLLRTETAPPGFPPATVARWAVRVGVAGGCRWAKEMEEEEIEDEGLGVEMIDTMPLPEPAAVTRADVEAALDAGGEGGRAARPPECVVVVLRWCWLSRERHLAVRRLSDIAGVVRNRGLPLVVVLTHKRSLRNWKRAEELKREVAYRARTDCVHFIENYTVNYSIKGRSPVAVKNDLETHYTALAIIRQCLEFVGQHRRQLLRKVMNNLAAPVKDKSSQLKEA